MNAIVTMTVIMIMAARPARIPQLSCTPGALHVSEAESTVLSPSRSAAAAWPHESKSGARPAAATTHIEVRLDATAQP